MPDMYDRIIDCVHENLPKFNPDTLFHARQDRIDEIPAVLDMAFTEAAKLYGDDVKHHGHRIMTPEEVIAYEVANPKYSSYVDVTRTEMVPAEFIHSYKGEEFRTLMYLPYITEDSIIINGSRYYLMFALTDKVFYHIEKDHGIGIKVLRAQLRFSRNMRCGFLTTKGRRYSDHIVIAKIHLRKYKYVADDIRTALILYPLVRYGLRGTMEKYGIDPDHVSICNFDDQEDPNWDHFCIRPSVDGKPGLYLRVHQEVLDAQYDHSRRLQIRVIVALMYILMYFDKCKNTIYTDNVELVKYLMDDPANMIYQTILGKTVYGINYETEAQVVGFANSHLNSLDTYIDPETKRKLRAIGVECRDIYDLIHYVDTHIDEYVVNYFPSNIYNKQLNVLDLVLGNLTRGIFNKVYKHTNNRKGGRPFETKEIASSFRIGCKALAKLYKCNGVIASNPSQYNDNWLLTVGARKKRATFATTSDGIGGGKAKKSGGDINLIHDAAHRLHSSMLYVESASRTQNTDPTIGGTINPFCPFDEFGSIVKAPWMDEVLPLDQYTHTK